MLRAFASGLADSCGFCPHFLLFPLGVATGGSQHVSPPALQVPAGWVRSLSWTWSLRRSPSLFPATPFRPTTVPLSQPHSVIAIYHVPRLLRPACRCPWSFSFAFRYFSLPSLLSVPVSGSQFSGFVSRSSGYSRFSATQCGRTLVTSTVTPFAFTPCQLAHLPFVLLDAALRRFPLFHCFFSFLLSVILVSLHSTSSGFLCLCFTFVLFFGSACGSLTPSFSCGPLTATFHGRSFGSLALMLPGTVCGFRRPAPMLSHPFLVVLPFFCRLGIVRCGLPFLVFAHRCSAHAFNLFCCSAHDFTAPCCVCWSFCASIYSFSSPF